LSLRGVKRTFSIFEYCFRGGIPCHEVVQNWVMRYGLYKLNKIPEKRDDWVFILDHSIEFGKKQCLLVLGIPLEKYRKKKCRLRHEDMEVLAADIVESATGKSVTNSLEKVAKKTGRPIQIISDGGRNLVRGCRDFIEKGNEDIPVRQTYDVTHKMALILKHQLKNDEIWQSFCKKTAISKRCLIHTDLAYLSPPKPRDKSRWQNLDTYVKWAEMVLKQKTKSMSKIDAEKFKDKLSWIKTYKSHIKEWRAMLDVLDAVKTEIKHNGLNCMTINNVKKSISFLDTYSQRLKYVYEEIMAYLEEECVGIDGVYLGCSDIIESMFGKYKNFSGKSPMKEIGRTILTIPVFAGTINCDEVKIAMETVSAKDVSEWQKDNLGTSLYSKRKQAFSLNNTKN